MERSGNTTQSAIETWRPTIKRLPRAVVLFVAAAAFIAACSSGPDSSRTVESTFANHSTPSDLAQSSEYLIRGTVNSDGSRVTLNKEAALAYMVSDVIVTEILGERPDAPIDLKVGEAISVGVGVLDERERSSVVNFDELAEPRHRSSSKRRRPRTVDATSFQVMTASRISSALAFDGDFAAAGFVEFRNTDQ